MRYDLCPLSNPEDVCPEAEGKYGIEHKDGTLGCKHPRNWVKKQGEENSNYWGTMGQKSNCHGRNRSNEG